MRFVFPHLFFYPFFLFSSLCNTLSALLHKGSTLHSLSSSLSNTLSAMLHIDSTLRFLSLCLFGQHIECPFNLAFFLYLSLSSTLSALVIKVQPCIFLSLCDWMQLTQKIGMGQYSTILFDEVIHNSIWPQICELYLAKDWTLLFCNLCLCSRSWKKLLDGNDDWERYMFHAQRKVFGYLRTS